MKIVRSMKYTIEVKRCIILQKWICIANDHLSIIKTGKFSHKIFTYACIMVYTQCCGSNRSLTAKILFYMICKPQSNHVTVRSNRSSSSLYISNGDVAQTAAVQTAAVCLGHNTFAESKERLLSYFSHKGQKSVFLKGLASLWLQSWHFIDTTPLNLYAKRVSKVLSSLFFI